MQKKIRIDEKIFQDLTKFYGNLFSLPPLAAKIYAFLIFDFEKVGVTFDDLVEIFSASKSSVSTSLNFLLNASLINDIAKIDERKRYFVTNENYVKIRFEKVVNRMQEEIKILEELNNFQKTNENFSQRFEIYKSLLNSNITEIQKTLNKL